MKTRAQYLSEYESVLSKTQQEQQQLSQLQAQKTALQNAQLQGQTSTANLLTLNNQITAVSNQIKAANTTLSSLYQQASNYTKELNNLVVNDTSLKQKIADVEIKYQDIINQIQQYQQASLDIMVLLNGFSAKAGLILNQAEVLAKLLPPEELVRTDILKNAMQLNHVEEFDKVIDKITEINFQDKDGKTLIMHAAANGFYYGVEKLLALGADVNILDKNGANLLIHAAKVPHLDYIRKIAELVDDVNCQDLEGNNAIHYAIISTKYKLFTEEFDKYDLSGGGNIYHCSASQLIGNLNIGDGQTFVLGGGGGAREDGHTIEQSKTKLIIEILLNCGTKFNVPNSFGQTPFHLACGHKLKFLVKALLEREGLVDLTLFDKSGQGALSWVAELHDLPALEMVLNTGLDINHQDATGKTLLFWMVEYGWEDMIDFLIAKGANLSLARNGDCAAPLHIALLKGEYSIFNKLINNGADVNCLDSAGTSLLHYAAELGDTGIIARIVAKGAVINHNNVSGVTPFYAACLKGNVQAMALIKDLATASFILTGTEFDINKLNLSGFHPIHGAIHNGHTSVVTELLKMGVSIETKSAQGYTAFQYYCELPNIKEEVLQFLLSKGADINCQDAIGRTPFYMACLNGKMETIVQLHRLGADINKLNQGFHPIHGAIHNGNTTIVEELLKLGVSIDTKSTSGYTPLQYYCQQPGSKIEVVQFLLAKGANLNAKQGDNDNTLIHSAVIGNNTEIVQLLIDRGIDVNIPIKVGHSPLLIACELNNIEMVKFLISKGGDVSKVAGKGETAMHYACGYGSIELVKYLLTMGATIEQKSTMDSDGVHEAFYTANLPVIDYLCEAGFDFNYKSTVEHKTPLHYLLENKNITSEKKISVIKKYVSKLDLSIQDNEGKDALIYAQEHCPEAIVFLSANSDPDISIAWTSEATYSDADLTVSPLGVESAEGV